MRKATVFAIGLMAIALAVVPTQGAISASATISSQQLSPTSYQYSLTLTNTGDTNISTFWFGWVPLYDLLPTPPTGFSSPTGWSGINAPDLIGTASAQWTTTTAPLAAGQSLSGFTFTSASAPAAFDGTYFGFPIKYSYVYVGAPETDPGFLFSPTVVAAPEPGTLAMLLGLPALLIRRKR